MTQKFSFVDRPPEGYDGRHRPGGLVEALRQTLANGTALHFPLNGQSYTVLRSRYTGTAYPTAKRLSARVRSVKAPDGGLLIWLEPNTDESPA